VGRVWSLEFKGCKFYRGLKFGLLHWLCLWALTQCSATYCATATCERHNQRSSHWKQTKLLMISQMQKHVGKHCSELISNWISLYFHNINIETISCPCNTCFWCARALVVRNTYSRGAWIFTANLRAIFNDNLRKNMGLSFIADYDSERVCRCGVFINSVRPMGSTPFNAFPFWVIFCHITLERSWVIGFCLHFCWMYVATAITYSEPSPS